MMYFGVFDSSQLQNLFYQRTRFCWIVCVHLLQCRVIACGKITTFQTIIALHLYAIAIIVIHVAPHLPFAANKHDGI